jgi:hypothetical protein
MKYWITYIVAALIAYSVVAMFKPVVTFTPKGLTLPIHKMLKQKHLTASVHLYPAWYQSGKKLAWVNVELHAVTQSKKAEKQIIDKARQMAGEYGANGLIIQALGFQPPGPNGAGLAMYVLHGVAIKTGAAS